VLDVFDPVRDLGLDPDGPRDRPRVRLLEQEGAAPTQQLIAALLGKKRDATLG
jgi:hypothetical protein